MFTRIIQPPRNKSFFLFGPRGTGKTTWLKTTFLKAVNIDLLESQIYNDLLARPERLVNFIPENFKDWIILDEVQRVPALLNEVHRLIEGQGYKFILTGSSARKLRRGKVNLLAGRALTYHMYPMTAGELGHSFNIQHALAFGHLPATFTEQDPKRYLESYIATYLREEVQQEGLTRNLAAFVRFLETMSFSQGSVINLSEIARESAVNRKIVESYCAILQDLLIADFLPFFTKRAKRQMVSHPKFYFFDVGIYKTLRPRGPLDTPEEVEGMSLETLFFQEIKAMNDYLHLGYQLFYWKSAANLEVDFVLYGESGIKAFEIKRTARISEKHLRGLKAFLKNYPMAKAYMIYGGTKKMREGAIEILPLQECIQNLSFYLKAK